jgi:hypothetical protein
MGSSEMWEFPNWEAAHAEFSRIGQEFAAAEEAVEISEVVGEELRAEALLEQTGTVDVRKAKVLLDPAVMEWRREHAKKKAKRSSLKQRLNAGEIWFRMVQTTSANIRAERNFQ